MENADNARADRARHFHVIPFSVGSLFRVRTYISVVCTLPRVLHMHTRALHVSRMHPRVSRFAYASIGYADASELRNL